MSNPLVSIIIPTFNRAHLIGETLDSVLAQTYTNWECIVVDDGSTDDTDKLLAAYCEKDMRFKYYNREILPKGASNCRNIGLEKAVGDYCIFLDSDDLLLDFCLTNRLDNIKLFSDNYFWVFPMNLKNQKQELTLCKIPKKTDYLEDFLSYKIHWGIMCTLWEINFLKSIGGFNVFYPRLNDPEIHIRAMLESKHKYKVFSDGIADSLYRIGNQNTDKAEFALKYYQSLTLFIPDITKKLIENNKKNQLYLLREYLKDYLRITYKNIPRKMNRKLFKVFYKNNILSFYQYLYLIIIYYSFLVSNFTATKAKNSINKLLEN